MDPLSHRSTAAVAATRTVLLPEVLDLGDTSYWLRCSKRYTRRLLREGRIHGRRVGRGWLVTRAELLRFLESEKNENAPAPPQLRVVPAEERGQ
jgi:excisionase family DNA binding protein